MRNSVSLRRIRNQSGQVLAQAMVVVLLVTTMGGLGVSLFTNELKRANDANKAGTRNSLTTVLNGYITNPTILHRSLYDSSCVTTQLALASPDLNSPTSSCLNLSGSVDSEGFRPIALLTPLGGGAQLTGTASAPVRYTIHGELCTAASEQCAYEVFTSFHNNVMFTENGVAKPSVRMRYMVRHQNTFASTDGRLNTHTFQGESTIPLEKINKLANPDTTDPCTTPTGAINTSLLGYIQMGIARNTDWINNTQVRCIPALGARVCPKTQFLVGTNANGEPVCAGAKTRCPSGQIQMGYRNGGTGGVEPRCVSADCSNRAGRFGFLRPTATDNLSTGFGCIIIQQDPNCENKVKTTISDSGVLGC